MESNGYSIFTREEWSRLRSSVPMTLGEDQLAALRGANEPMSLAEVEAIYLPLVRLINLHVSAARGLATVTDEFVGRPPVRRPYVIAIAGSVAVGKSTIARLLQTLLSRWSEHPRVDLITTDGFLWPREKLLAEGLMERKGFPESYDVRTMIDFLARVRSTGEGRAPVYSHQSYDIVPGMSDTVDHPDILIFEGLNVLQIGDGVSRRHAPVFTPADFFDLSLYVDADPAHIERWYVDRFLVLQQTRMQDPDNYFYHLARASRKEARAYAEGLWHKVNLPNLLENILPTRNRADVVLHKDFLHAADSLWLRRT
ncbi:MAG: type I pantothenate kinase [Pseudomonadota bacterium]|uniref:type I pantothenate kinase n=1 Tax=Sphingomonas sp. ERG5 TaxID=1381597 RepID=UPI00054B2BC3|nr:type I pantothenate kinase [Sphingomonas sp. ERG5]